MLEDWNSINWKRVQINVYSLQVKIFEASLNKDESLVHVYQNSLVNSLDAKLLAIRKITLDKKSKKLVGVDKIGFVNPAKRLKFLKNFKIDGQASPIKTIVLEKTDIYRNQPFRIPTFKDSAKQYLVKFALEPQWEALFEKNNYGFRPGRRAQDAAWSVYMSLVYGERFVLSGELEISGHNFNVQKFLTKINTTSTIANQIGSWLKVGILDSKISTQNYLFHHTTTEETLFPLLSNILFHGLEGFCHAIYYNILRDLNLSISKYRHHLHVIFYKNSLVIIHNNLQVIQAYQKRLNEFCDQEANVKLKNSHICSTVYPIKFNGQTIKPGFDFLGFTFKSFVSKTYPSVNPRTKEKINLRPCLKPSFSAMVLHLKNLKFLIKKYRGFKQKIVISKLNPFIKHFCEYFKFCSATKAFTSCDNYLFNNLWYSWGCWRHGDKTRKWVLFNYFKKYKNRSWVFLEDKSILISHQETLIKKFIKVKQSYSPFNTNEKTTIQHFSFDIVLGYLFKNKKDCVLYVDFLLSQMILWKSTIYYRKTINFAIKMNINNCCIRTVIIKFIKKLLNIIKKKYEKKFKYNKILYNWRTYFSCYLSRNRKR